MRWNAALHGFRRPSAVNDAGYKKEMSKALAGVATIGRKK
jgi:hypothetical protein